MRAVYIITACRASSALRAPPPSSPCLKAGASGGGCGEFKLEPPALVMLAVLMLRGPQTLGELKA
ncbi:DUF480 domain-containing protein, partial [Acinetobacter baumannii]|uniref:DUF480 domain-containing protein n=1 Tax=Acinetobacter baumannii TaxID=470 RepID=UPI00398C6B47